GAAGRTLGRTGAAPYGIGGDGAFRKDPARSGSPSASAFLKPTMYRLLLLALLSGCSMWAPVLEEPPTIWVAREFTGGRQCSDETFTPPDTRELLAAAGVRVYDVWVEHLAVIAVCGAP